MVADKLPDTPDWRYELKYDGFRALAIRTDGRVCFRSRNNNDFTSRFPAVVKAVAAIPNETVLDGEIVALDEEGRPSFNLLQTYGSATAPLLYYVFDVMVLDGRDVIGEPLDRRELLERVISQLGEPVRLSPDLKASLADLTASVKAQGVEGIVAKTEGQPIRARRRARAPDRR